MLVETLSTFPEVFDSFMGSSMMKLAQEKGLLEYKSYNLRDWAEGVHQKTDDKPFGGGPGQLMMCEPIFKAHEDITSKGKKATTIFLSPAGKVFDDKEAKKLAKVDRLLFVCGHYEGIDERAYTLADEVYSIGDYVLTSGELASSVIIDAVVRKLPGVLGADDGANDESFANGLLEYPQYTRPADFRGMKVPEVLLSGDHAKIQKWKEEKSLERTQKLRPDLLDK